MPLRGKCLQSVRQTPRTLRSHCARQDVGETFNSDSEKDNTGGHNEQSADSEEEHAVIGKLPYTLDEEIADQKTKKMSHQSPTTNKLIKTSVMCPYQPAPGRINSTKTGSS